MSRRNHHFNLIGLTGLAGAGKDTVADLLVTHCGYKKIAFADALRGEVAEAFGIDIRLLTDRSTKETATPALALERCSNYSFIGMVASAALDGERLDFEVPRAPRQILQWWGTEYRRKLDPGYWRNKLGGIIGPAIRDRQCVRWVITDVRFPNEAAMVRDPYDGQIWQITRPGTCHGAVPHVSDVTGSEFAPDRVLHNLHDMRHLQQLVLGECWSYESGVPGLSVRLPNLEATA